MSKNNQTGDATLKFLLAATCLLLLLGWVLRISGCTNKVTEIEREVYYEKPDESTPPIRNPGSQYLYLDNIEDAIVQDLTGLDEATRLQTRYLVLSDVFNQGSDRLEEARNGAMKSINQLSRRRLVSRGTFIDPEKTILRVDLRDYFGNEGPDIWRTVEYDAVIEIVSETVRNRTAQFFTQTRQPWMHASVFAETALTNETYYDIMEIPDSLGAFYKDVLRINQQALFDDRDPGITLLGFDESVISPDTNRLMLRIENDDGGVWQTYDVDINSRGDVNVFQAPFVKEAGSRRVFAHDAQEFIYPLPNGLHGYALYDAAGVRTNDAPETIVTNIRTSALGLTPEIRNARDCLSCHAGGFIPAIDQVGQHIKTSQFNAADKRLGELFFKPQRVNDAFFDRDNAVYRAALRQIGISGELDPINYGLLDPIRTGLDLKEAAAFLFIDEDELSACIEGSENASIEVGPLANGGTVGFTKFAGAVKTIIDDCNLFIDIE